MYFVDRSVVVLKPTQIFLDWLNQMNADDDSMPDLTLNQLRSNCTTFLIPQFDEPEQAVAYINERYQAILDAELAGWLGDEDLPQNRDFAMFTAFFELEIHDMVLDLEDSELQPSRTAAMA